VRVRACARGARGDRPRPDDAADADAVLSRFFGREVELAAAAPDGYTIDQYHPDEANYDPEGHRDAVVEARLGAAFFSDQGLPSAVPADSFFDLFPLSVVTTSTLDELANAIRRATSTLGGSA
jgi:MOSC domain-containing protein